MVKFLIRISSFLGKELTEIFRQPKLILTLVLGPFLIMSLFCLALFSDSLQKPAVDFIHVDAGYGLNVPDLERVHFIMIDLQLGLLIVLNGLEGRIWNDDHKVSLVESQLRECQIFICLDSLVNNCGAV